LYPNKELPKVLKKQYTWGPVEKSNLLITSY
jgi:hypothetical protein